MKPKRPLIIAGASGQGDVLFDCATEMGLVVQAFIDPNVSLPREKNTRPVYRDIGEIENKKAYDYLIAIGNSTRRRFVFDKYRLILPIDHFPFVIHPSTNISATATVEPASIILRNTIIEPNVKISTGSLVNNASIISHGVKLGEFSSVGPSATIAGGAVIGKNTTIGMGSNVIQNCKIGSNVVIGAGSTVIDNIPDGKIAHGVPAKLTT